PTEPVNASARSAAYSIEGTLQQSQVLDGQSSAGSSSYFFGDLPPKLQRVLSSQLRAPGDISAVVETPTRFLVYLGGERTTDKLSATVISLSKKLYEDWIHEQN